MKAPASFRSMDSRGTWCEVTVIPTPTEGWSITWSVDGDRTIGHSPFVREVRDRIRAALITSGLGERVPDVHIHVHGGGYWPGFDIGVALAIVAPDRIHDGLTGELGLDGKVHPALRYIEELNSPVEDLAELRPPRVDAVARVVSVP